MATRNGLRSCREIVAEFLSDEKPHTQQEIMQACEGLSQVTVLNTLSEFQAHGMIVRTVSITYQIAQNRRKSNG